MKKILVIIALITILGISFFWLIVRAPRVSQVEPPTKYLAQSPQTLKASTNIPSDIPRLDANQDVNPTVTDMKSKGLPPISNPRQFELNRVVGQSIKNCILDLGDPYTLYTSRPNPMTPPTDLRTWDHMSYHLRLLRIVEEGRRDAQSITPLLISELHRSKCEELSAMIDNGLMLMAMGKNLGTDPMSDENDPYFKKNHAFKGPINEFFRRIDSLGQCFYILANINRLTDAEIELAAFSNTGIRDMYRPDNFVVWLIACDIAERQRKKLPVDPRLVELVRPLDFQAVSRTKWNFGADKDDPMLTMADVDKSGIPTISVLGIPQELPQEMTDHQQEIMTLFREMVAKDAAATQPAASR